MNPNPTNDLYRNMANRGDIIAVAIYILTYLGIIIFLCKCMGSGHVSFLLTIFTLATVGVLCYWIRMFYVEIVLRKRIIAHGIAYSGELVAQRQTDRTYVVGRRSVHRNQYAIDVKCGEKIYTIDHLNLDPQKYLANPYCTVYVWKGKIVAKDFGVK